MAAGGGSFEMEPFAGGGFLSWIAARTEKRVVGGVYQQGGQVDGREKLAAAIACPVIGGVFKPMDRRGVAVVEFLERADLGEAGEVELAGKQPIFGADFAAHLAEEAFHVQPVRAFREFVGRACEVAGDGECDGTVELAWQGFRVFAEVFQGEIST